MKFHRQWVEALVVYQVSQAYKIALASFEMECELRLGYSSLKVVSARLSWSLTPSLQTILLSL
jgi:hypothetical protein